MVNKDKNRVINSQLKALYKEYTDEFLEVYSRAYECDRPCKINEFGIVDIDTYDADNGVLFVSKESNGWSDDDFRRDYSYRLWLYEIVHNGLSAAKEHTKRNPLFLYNLGRWSAVIHDRSNSISELCFKKSEVLPYISRIAYTNINKVKGENVSGRQYSEISKSDVAQMVIKKEIEIISPKIIVCCGTYETLKDYGINEFDSKAVKMPHLSCRKNIGKLLNCLQEQLRIKHL